VTAQAILWRRLDTPGHEASRYFLRDSSWHVEGTAVFAHHAQPCRLDYVVVCNAAWHTVSGTVQGWVGDETIAIEIAVDAQRRWWLNGTECPPVVGSTDLDLNFSPSTNLLPIRRLGLAVGQEARSRPPGCASRVSPWSRLTSGTVVSMRRRIGTRVRGAR
jgi:uncharacterized protein